MTTTLHTTTDHVFTTWHKAQRVARRIGNAWPSVVTGPNGARTFRVVVMVDSVAHILTDEEMTR